MTIEIGMEDLIETERDVEGQGLEIGQTEGVDLVLDQDPIQDPGHILLWFGEEITLMTQ